VLFCLSCREQAERATGKTYLSIATNRPTYQLAYELVDFAIYPPTAAVLLKLSKEESDEVKQGVADGLAKANLNYLTEQLLNLIDTLALSQNLAVREQAESVQQRLFAQNHAEDHGGEGDRQALYKLGRLLSLLQKRALVGDNRRTYQMAVLDPNAIIPSLIKRIADERTRILIEEELGSEISSLSFPTYLYPEGQWQFALGYYEHQVKGVQKVAVRLPTKVAEHLRGLTKAAEQVRRAARNITASDVRRVERVAEGKLKAGDSEVVSLYADAATLAHAQIMEKEPRELLRTAAYVLAGAA